ncbi:UDP-N-acetylmuramate:L-alanyl-gamma-D-glutamyl-meso-diaminopimelate ligase [Candidatus Pandoraea novymonadis]|uniref:UDP-N-acetylmuramate--L-alanyl-gamma-D-glutamyl-meso-2,6-diaminoheptandioate ligase n=1 Tax=Candidatus Pandoraea novymonadis TaxID=1808959 RepID=A0ABX5FFW7_9BURK|nr:UDP-N-acetylmuramate:L-alanyl-gamma-D-glutamyl-meso-diaminopimelate ligase [Candidatus Pandoraea novymonadis]PSB92368.1 UDP-N-acetylmuramate--L-alanyl-gamma-D-glutamyl-meso-2,6-diaminoheptandioate ligase [Candidatus Pandoraea novymonadis]
MHIHILGICGTFMGGLAVLAREAGYTVTGCDVNVYPPMSTQLEMQGISLIDGFDAKQVLLAPDMFVIGNVISRGNPLMEEILNRNLPYMSGPQWLGEYVLCKKWVLAVAGTHGKTTTTSMLSWILEDTGYNPGFLIGGVPINFNISARLTDSDFFVIEADEYDTAFFDKRSKFVHYRPRTLILNNLEYDHADIFSDLMAIEMQFHNLIRTVPSQGRLVLNGRETGLQRVLERGCWSTVEYFGVSDSWHVDEGMVSATPGEEAFWVRKGLKIVGQVKWGLHGEHNQLNALAAIAAAHHVGVKPQLAVASLEKFQNVKRRMERCGTVNGVTVFDDFAHHPTAIRNILAGLRKCVGQAARILAVLEPRSNTMKLGMMKVQLAASLADADLVFVYEALAGKDILSWDVVKAFSPLGDRAQVHNDIDGLVRAIVAVVQPFDQVVVISNGSFGGIHQKLLDALVVGQN